MKVPLNAIVIDLATGLTGTLSTTNVDSMSFYMTGSLTDYKVYEKCYSAWFTELGEGFKAVHEGSKIDVYRHR